MALWKLELDPFIKILATPSPAVLPLLFSLPGIARSAHIAVYLPTSGRDAEFITALASRPLVGK